MADDVAEIAKRIKQIRENEAPATNDDIETASGHDLRLLANRYGAKWEEHDSDYSVRGAIRGVIAREAEAAAKLKPLFGWFGHVGA